MGAVTRPLYGWPTWKLRLALMFPRWRSVWAEAFLELHHRSAEEVRREVDATANDETGPYRVAMPEGMH